MRRQRLLRFDGNALEELWDLFPRSERARVLKLLAQLIACAAVASIEGMEAITWEVDDEVSNTGFEDHR